MPQAGLYEYNGKTMTLREWSKELEISYYTMKNRRRKGLPPEELYAPSRTKRYEYRGRRLTIAQWSKELGIDKRTFYDRISREIPTDRVFNKGLLDQTTKNGKPIMKYEFQGRSMFLRDWAAEYGLNSGMVHVRYHKLGKRGEELFEPSRETEKLTYEGETNTLHAWSRKTGISYMTIRYRIRKGYPVERVLHPESFIDDVSKLHKHSNKAYRERREYDHFMMMLKAMATCTPEKMDEIINQLEKKNDNTTKLHQRLPSGHGRYNKLLGVTGKHLQGCLRGTPYRPRCIPIKNARRTRRVLATYKPSR